jgi:hypothetical protein
MEKITTVILAAYTTEDEVYTDHYTLVDGDDVADAKEECLSKMNDYANGAPVRIDWIIVSYDKPSIPETVTTLELPVAPASAAAEITVS